MLKNGISFFIYVPIFFPDDTRVLLIAKISVTVIDFINTICSGTHHYPNINEKEKGKKIEKGKRKLQRLISKRQEKNKKGERYYRTSNIIKREKELLKGSYKRNKFFLSYITVTM